MNLLGVNYSAKVGNGGPSKIITNINKGFFTGKNLRRSPNTNGEKMNFLNNNLREVKHKASNDSAIKSKENL